MMMKETGTNSKKFIWRQRIGFGISDYACNLAYLMVNTYLLIFYTDVAGIPAASAAFMFLITKFIDAFTDYMVVALVDLAGNEPTLHFYPSTSDTDLLLVELRSAIFRFC